MKKHLLVGMTGVFWITMMILLWRAEYRGEASLGSSVSPEVVWEKILTAPDDSTLSIAVKGRKIGYCRWVPNIADPESTGKISSENTPEGMIQKPTGYTLLLEGSYLFEEDGARLRFEANAALRTNYTWRTLDVKASVNPQQWSINADAVRQKVSINFQEGAMRLGHTFNFAQLQNPAGLLSALGMPSIPLPMASLSTLTNNPNISLGLDWKAYNDVLKIGPSQLRVYRLRARLLESYEVSIVTTRVGEILRMELPNGIVLVNDLLMTFTPS